MNYLIYKITNQVNGKVYIGAHQTQNINDNYMGSGIAIKRAIKKYGVENFNKEILANCDSLTDMYQYERSLVTEEFVNDSQTYNIRIGGLGGFDHINKDQSDARISQRNSYLEKAISQVVYLMEHDREWKDKFCASVSTGLYKRFETEVGTFTNKHHTPKTKKLMSESKKITSKGERNSQFGTCWVYSLNLEQNKKILKNELSIYETQGWVRGRKMKF